MKKHIILILSLILSTLIHAETDSLLEVPRNRHIIGVQVGTDIGGAVPFPLSNIPETFKPIPKIYSNLGVKYTIMVHDIVDLTAEVNYKHVEMGADALVENMRARIPNANGQGKDLVQYFTGRAEMNMSFDIMEVPIYLTIRIPNYKKNKFLIGPYFAWNVKTSFHNTPINGFIGTAPDVVDLIISPESPIPPSQMQFTDFTQYMSSWDWGVSIGYEREIYKRMNIALKISVGMKDIFSTQVLDYSMNTIRGTVTFSYDLFRF